MALGAAGTPSSRLRAHARSLRACTPPSVPLVACGQQVGVPVPTARPTVGPRRCKQKYKSLRNRGGPLEHTAVTLKSCPQKCSETTSSVTSLAKVAKASPLLRHSSMTRTGIKPGFLLTRRHRMCLRLFFGIEHVWYWWGCTCCINPSL